MLSRYVNMEGMTQWGVGVRSLSIKKKRERDHCPWVHWVILGQSTSQNKMEEGRTCSFANNFCSGLLVVFMDSFVSCTLVAGYKNADYLIFICIMSISIGWYLLQAKHKKRGKQPVDSILKTVTKVWKQVRRDGPLDTVLGCEGLQRSHPPSWIQLRNMLGAPLHPLYNFALTHYRSSHH